MSHHYRSQLPYVVPCYVNVMKYKTITKYHACKFLFCLYHTWCKTHFRLLSFNWPIAVSIQYCGCHLHFFLNYPANILYFFFAIQCSINNGLSLQAIYCESHHNWHNFWQKFISHEKCLVIVSTAFIWNLSQPKTNSARYYHKFAYIFM